MPFESISPGPSLITQAYSSILNAICGGRLQPGERLNQDAIAERLSISRQPVGQALSILKTQGFVRDTGRRGLIVAPIERAFFVAIYELREALDPMAARLAAERANDDDRLDGRQLLGKGLAAVRHGGIEDAIAADMNFHMWMYRAAKNPLLVETMGLYWNHLRRAMAEVLRHAGERTRVWDEHEAILKSIVAGDAEGAGRRAFAHARDASRRIASSIPVALQPSAGEEEPETKAPRPRPRRKAAR